MKREEEEDQKPNEKHNSTKTEYKEISLTVM
jgi:hypothetical protein